MGDFGKLFDDHEEMRKESDADREERRRHLIERESGGRERAREVLNAVVLPVFRAAKTAAESKGYRLIVVDTPLLHNEEILGEILFSPFKPGERSGIGGTASKLRFVYTGGSVFQVTKFVKKPLRSVEDTLGSFSFEDMTQDVVKPIVRDFLSEVMATRESGLL